MSLRVARIERSEIHDRPVDRATPSRVSRRSTRTRKVAGPSGRKRRA
jgi:hypothetical protein